MRFFFRVDGAERYASPAPGSGTGLRLLQTNRAPRCRVQALVRCFGGYAATHLKGTKPAHLFLAILTRTSWVVVTVPALVLCARLLGWSREVATTSRVTGPCLLPFGRLHVACSFPPLTTLFRAVLVFLEVL